MVFKIQLNFLNGSSIPVLYIYQPLNIYYVK